MQDRLKRPEILPMGGRLLELNPEIVALYGEVEAGSERLPVSIAERTDPAYENPEKIKEVFPMMESYNLIAIFPVGYPEEDAKPSHLHTTRKSEDEFIETL